MNAELVALLQDLLAYMLLLSAQLAVILALRVPVARYLGATTAYRLWTLPLLWLPFFLLELPAPDWSWLSEVLQFGSNPQGSVSWFPLALQEFDLPLALNPIELMAWDDSRAAFVWRAALLLWLTVTALLLGVQLLRIHQFNRALRIEASKGELPQAEQMQLPAGLQVCFVQGLTSPALFGIIRPYLLLPADFLQRFDTGMRTLIIKHELVHYRRRDNLWNLVAMLLRTMFWFNPLLHVAWHCFRLDQELACDERVLQGSHPDEGKQYARTLLESMSDYQQGKQPATITAWGNLRELRERTQMIKLHQKLLPRQRTGSWLLALCIVSGGIATATLEIHSSVAIAAEAPAQGSLSQEFSAGIERVMQLRDAQDYAAATAVLDTLEQDEMNLREQYTLLLFRANLAQIQKQYADAIVWYEELLALDGITDEQRRQTLMQLGSLYYALEKYMTAIDYFQGYIDLSEDPQIQTTLRIAYAYYQLKDYENTALYAEQAIALGEQTHNIYALLRAAYLSVDNIEEGRRINDKMLELFDNADDEAMDAQFRNPEVRIDVADERPKEEYLPIKVIQPRYPNRALLDKIEGSVTLSFTVNEQGAVVDPTVVTATPEGYFEEAVLAAISRFEFNPRLDSSGLAVATPDVRYVFRFNISE